MNSITVGYLPLSDSLPLLVLKHLALDTAHGIQVELQRMGSWAQLRDTLLAGHIQAAHCLAGIPLAAQAGLYGQQHKLATALTLNHYGNGITVNRQLFDSDEPAKLAERLHQLRDERARQGKLLSFASVFPVSKHEFELRHWLSSMQLEPDRDVRMQVVPPSLIADSLRAGRIDGFCVGEPWNSLACAEGLGILVSSSRTLGLPGTEKVLAVREDWLHNEAHFALLKGLISACDWLAQPHNKAQAVELLATELSLPQDPLLTALIPQIDAPMQTPQPLIRFDQINRPDRGHARWLLEQILKQLESGDTADTICQRAFRPDIYDLVHP